jgi:preprotein translocase subunit YajC
MHLIHTLLAASSTATTTSGSKKSKSSSELPLLILIAVFAGGYFFFIRPRQQRIKQQQQQKSRQLAVGDPVITAGGIHGKIVGLDADVAEVEVAPGVVLTVLTRSVSLHPDAPRGDTQGSAPSSEKWNYPNNSNNNFDGSSASPPADADLSPPKKGEEDQNLPPAGDA